MIENNDKIIAYVCTYNTYKYKYEYKLKNKMKVCVCNVNKHIFTRRIRNRGHDAASNKQYNQLIIYLNSK